MTDLPQLALSVRQPWAWAIIHAGKDIENRTARSISFMQPIVGWRAIHASRHLTRDEYEEGRAFLTSLGIACPPAIELQRGGIIGSVDVTGVVKESASPWFFGPRGLVLANPRPCEFIPARGELGCFRWKSATDLAGARVTVPRWMLPAEQQRRAAPDDLFAGEQKEPEAEPDLFGGEAAQ
jgi:hypothetical protein